MKKQTQFGLLATFAFTLITAPTVALDIEEHWQQTIERAYDRAVEDAAAADASEIEQLMPIVPSNDALIWQNIDGEEYLKVVTWTSWDGYDSEVGQEMILSRDIWITPTPQIQQLTQTLAPDEEILTLRLEQLMGLPPNNGKNRWVEMWVKPVDLFRPCPDADITDTECDLYFPADATEEHKAWIVNLTLSSYGENGYPWTRLGYTYDWGGVGTEVGANELVIRGGSTVMIESVQSNTDYLQSAQ